MLNYAKMISVLTFSLLVLTKTNRSILKKDFTVSDNALKYTTNKHQTIIIDVQEKAVINVNWVLFVTMSVVVVVFRHHVRRTCCLSRWAVFCITSASRGPSRSCASTPTSPAVCAVAPLMRYMRRAGRLLLKCESWFFSLRIEINDSLTILHTVCCQ